MNGQSGSTSNVRVVTPDRILGVERGLGQGDADYPTAPDENMSSQELADFQQQFTAWSRQRILTDGLRQYDRGDRQAFEDLDFPTLITYAQEELADIVNYAAMLSIKLQRLKESV